jgi:MFS family permease
MTAATSVEVDAPEITTAQQRRRVGWSAFLGTTIEYYDFTLYGLFGPIVFAELFFPKSDPSTALIAVLAIYAVGFFGRPFGGLVFSHYGDKIGRKPTMIVSMTLMGLASVAMGLLPGYASIGIWAPILLLVLRVLQGFALGGESAGANVFSTEVSPEGKRGFFTSLVTSGIFVAWILAVSATTAVQFLARDELLSWGWRLPFLASILLVALGIWMRLNIEESAVFLKAVKKKQIARVPIVELLRVARKPAFIVLFAAMAESTSGFFFLVFAYSYAIQALKIPPATLLQALLIANIIGLFLTPMFGALSDRIGRRWVLASGYIFAGVYVLTVFFPMLSSGNTTLVYLAMILPIIITSPISLGVIASFYSEQFQDARLRYSGVGVGRGLGTTLGGGLMPVIGASLIALGGGSVIGPILWFNLIMLAGVIAIFVARETRNETLE